MKTAFHYQSNYILIFNPETGFYLQQKNGEITDHGVMKNQTQFADIINLKLTKRFIEGDTLARIEAVPSDT